MVYYSLHNECFIDENKVQKCFFARNMEKTLRDKIVREHHSQFTMKKSILIVIMSSDDKKNNLIYIFHRKTIQFELVFESITICREMFDNDSNTHIWKDIKGDFYCLSESVVSRSHLNEVIYEFDDQMILRKFTFSQLGKPLQYTLDTLTYIIGNVVICHYRDNNVGTMMYDLTAHKGEDETIIGFFINYYSYTQCSGYFNNIVFDSNCAIKNQYDIRGLNNTDTLRYVVFQKTNGDKIVRTYECTKKPLLIDEVKVDHVHGIIDCGFGNLDLLLMEYEGQMFFRHIIHKKPEDPFQIEQHNLEKINSSKNKSSSLTSMPLVNDPNKRIIVDLVGNVFKNPFCRYIEECYMWIDQGDVCLSTDFEDKNDKTKQKKKGKKKETENDTVIKSVLKSFYDDNYMDVSEKALLDKQNDQSTHENFMKNNIDDYIGIFEHIGVDKKTTNKNKHYSDEERPKGKKQSRIRDDSDSESEQEARIRDDSDSESEQEEPKKPRKKNKAKKCDSDSDSDTKREAPKKKGGKVPVQKSEEKIKFEEQFRSFLRGLNETNQKMINSTIARAWHEYKKGPMTWSNYLYDFDYLGFLDVFDLSSGNPIVVEETTEELGDKILQTMKKMKYRRISNPKYIFTDVYQGDNNICAITSNGEIFVIRDNECRLVRTLKTSLHNNEIYKSFNPNSGKCNIECDIAMTVPMFVVSYGSHPYSNINLSIHDLEKAIASGSGPLRDSLTRFADHFESHYLIEKDGHMKFNFDQNIPDAEKTDLYWFYLAKMYKYSIHHTNKNLLKMPIDFIYCYAKMYHCMDEMMYIWEYYYPESFNNYLSDPKGYYDGKSLEEIICEMFDIDMKIDSRMTIFCKTVLNSIPKEKDFTFFDLFLFFCGEKEKQVMLSRNNFKTESKKFEPLINYFIGLDASSQRQLLKNWTGYRHIGEDNELNMVARNYIKFSMCSQTLMITDSFLEDPVNWSLLLVDDGVISDRLDDHNDRDNSRVSRQIISVTMQSNNRDIISDHNTEEEEVETD